MSSQPNYFVLLKYLLLLSFYGWGGLQSYFHIKPNYGLGGGWVVLMMS